MSIYQSGYTGAEIDERLEWAEEISPHITKNMNTEAGIHGIRYWQDTLEYYNGTAWVEIETGGGGSSVTVKTASAWTSENPILLLGEIGVEGDTNKIKIGNGIGRWNTLSYIAQGAKGDPGQDGYTPVKGIDYFDGNNGYTPIKGVDYSDGAKGDDGVSPTVTVNTNNQTTYKLNITDSSGTITTPNLKGTEGGPGEKGDTGPKGDKPAHQWVGTSLQIENPNGTWGTAINLKGESGEGSGNMHTSTYDPTGKNADIFAYTDTGLSGKVNNARVLTDVPAGAKFTDTVYTHPTTAGNKHIPTGGASGQFLKYSASGTAVWGADNDTITTVNGKTGAITKTDITSLGIPAQDTVYTHPTTSGNKHIPSGGSANQILKYSADGTAVWADNAGGSSVTVVDNLTSTSTTNALSANQGRELDELISTVSGDVDAKAQTITYTTTVTTTWTGTSAPFSQAVTVTGITANDNPIADIVLTGTYEADMQMEADWANIYRIVTSTNTVTFYSHAKTEMSIPVQFKVVR